MIQINNLQKKFGAKTAVNIDNYGARTAINQSGRFYP